MDWTLNLALAMENREDAFHIHTTMHHAERPPAHKDDRPQYPDHRLLTAKYFCPGTGTPMPARDHLWPKRYRQLLQCPESFYDSSVRGYSNTRDDELSRVSRVVSDRPSRS